MADTATKPITRSRFLRAQQISEILPCNLNNPVANVYRNALFRGFKYDIPTPVLQLATHLLQASLAIFWTVFANQPKDTGKTGVLGGRLHEFPEPPTKLTAEQERWTWKQLDILGQNIGFKLCEYDSKSSYARTIACLNMKPKGAVPGSPSLININRHFYQSLEADCSAQDDSISFLLSAWHWADTLNHELIHAALTLVTPRSIREADEFFITPSVQTTEEGLELQSRLYGGMPSWITSDGYCVGDRKSRAIKMPVMFDWPSLHVQDSAYGGTISFRGNFPLCNVMWSVPFEWVNSLFRNEFWEQEHSSPGGLKIRRTEGWRILCKIDEPVRLYPETSEDDVTVYLPDGYTSTEKGMVTPKSLASGAAHQLHAARPGVQLLTCSQEALDAGLMAQQRRRRG